jgi:aminoglycoside phosphotransferase (APT) family kinase protein
MFELESLLRRAFPGCRIGACRGLSGGISSQATLCALVLPDQEPRRVVVRRPSGDSLPESRAIAAREFRVLSLARRAGVPVPTPLFHDESEGALVLDYVPGEVDFRPLDLGASMRELARTLAAIHRITPKSDEFSFLPERARTAEAQLARRPPQLDEALAEPRLRGVLESLWPWPARNPTRLLHGDFWPGNVLWHQGKLSAVIDWEEAERGDPLADLAVARLDLSWAFGWDAMQCFTEEYRSLNQLDFSYLPHWELCVALRPMSNLPRWASAYPAPPVSRPDIDEAHLRQGHRRFVEDALSRL